MLKSISVIGGDLRMVKLVQMLNEEDWDITVYGLENADFECKGKIKVASGLKQAIEANNLVLSSVPLSKDGKIVNSPFSKQPILWKDIFPNLNQKMFIAGGLREQALEEIERSGGKAIDLLKQEELTVLNTISTAEGAIQIAMEETSRTIHGTNAIVLGFGRVGKVVADRLKGLGAKVACEARKKSDLAWIKAYGYEPIDLQDLDANLGKYTIIINTVPSMMIDEARAKLLNKEAVVIDLASYPGGADKEAMKNNQIKYILALALPGKVAPVTSAEYIKETLYNVILK